MLTEENGAFVSNGVSVSTPVSADEQSVLVRYNGLLAENGATEVFAHVGRGQSWDDASDYKMIRTDQGFEAAIPVMDYTDSLHLCFRDSADNWDNNGGENYSIAAEHYLLPSESPATGLGNKVMDFFSKYLSFYSKH